jgi:hypothetical protein
MSHLARHTEGLTRVALEKPSDSFRRLVLPAWQHYRANPTAEWAAIAAARAAHSHHEWLHKYYARYDPERINGATKPHEFRQALEVQCPDIKVVKDVADAAGHRILDRGDRIVASSTAAFVTDANELYIRDTGRNFADALGNVVQFWANWPD